MQNFLALILPFIFMFGILYFLMIRPQNKREAKRLEVVNALQKGDHIKTFGGIIGVVSAVNDKSIFIRTGSSEIEIGKESIALKTNN